MEVLRKLLKRSSNKRNAAGENGQYFVGIFCGMPEVRDLGSGYTYVRISERILNGGEIEGIWYWTNSPFTEDVEVQGKRGKQLETVWKIGTEKDR